MRAVHIFCAGALLLLASHADAFSLKVAGGGGCTGFQYNIQKSEYTYNETMGNVTYGEGCTPADLSISKLYIPGACANTRENNFGFSSLNPTHLNCDTVENYSQDTCNTVFDQAPASAIVTNLTSDEFIESEDVCWPAHVGFIFVKNNCTNDCQVAVNVELHNYNGPGCDIVDIGIGNGVGLSPGAIVGIVIAAVVVVLLLALCLYCCCCQLRKG